MQSDPNVFGMPWLFSNAVCFDGCLHFLRTMVDRSQKATKWLRKGFLAMHFLFTRFSSSKSSFCGPFAFPLQKKFGYLIVSRPHWAFNPLLVRSIRFILVWSGNFLSTFLSGYSFIRIETGSTSDSHSLGARVNARPPRTKIYPTLYLFDSHPLSVNPALIQAQIRLRERINSNNNNKNRVRAHSNTLQTQTFISLLFS